MTLQAILFVLIIIGGTALLSWPLGRYMAGVMDPKGGKGAMTGLFQSIAGPLGREEQGWKAYVFAMLAFNIVIFTVVYLIQTFQGYLPFNPDAMGAVNPDLMFNTAASFTTNTNLQHYSGEATYSYFTQLGGLMWLQFVTPAVGLAALIAMARALSGRAMGNFWVDLQRATFLMLLPLPLSLVFAALLVIGGLPMTFEGSVTAITLEGVQQTIARGPVAAFVTIKQLGTNGGGFFGPNSTHPLENVSFYTNMIQMVAIILVPMACVWMFARIVGRIKHGLAPKALP